MADNTTLDAGAGGDVIATDDAGGVKYQIVKLADGTADATTVVSVAAGVAANALRTTLASDDPAVTSLQLIDNAVSGAGFNVTQLGGVGVALNTGVRSTGTQRVTIATDDVVPVTGTFWQATQPVSGTVTANPASGTIDTVTNLAQMNGAALSMGNGISGTGVQRVSLASDSTGQVTLATGAAAIGKLAAGVAEIGNVKNSGTFAVQSTLQAGTAAIGKLVANTGVDIGDVDVTSIIPGTGATNLGKAVDSVAGATDTGVAALVRRRDAATAITPADADYTYLNVNSLGQLWVTGTHLEDAAHASGDPGLQLLAVSSALSTAVAGAAGDYQPLCVSSTTGRLFTNAVAATSTTGGATFYLNQDTSAKAAVKASAGTLYSICCFNTHTAAVYLNLYNVALASVTLGTTTPNMQFVVPTQAATANGGGFVINFGPVGIAFGTAITVACATTFDGAADPGTNLVITNISYA